MERRERRQVRGGEEGKVREEGWRERGGMERSFCLPVGFCSSTSSSTFDSIRGCDIS